MVSWLYTDVSEEYFVSVFTTGVRRVRKSLVHIQLGDDDMRGTGQ
jgi:hypothetical protein